MQFQNAIITEQGVRIFQAALANNPVVFTKCLFSGSATPLTASMIALPEPTWGNGHVTNYASDDSGGDFIIYASATNATDYGYAYGYGIYGYLQNEGIENEKLLVVANYDGNVTYVSEASGPYTRFHFAITIKLSMAAGVLSIAPHYNGLVSDVAFQNLANRTVTTHSAADAQVGDAQIVRGQKHFYDTTYFGGDSNAPFIEIDSDGETGSMYLNAEHESQQIRVQMKPKDYGDDSNNNVYVNTNISPSGNGVVSLGANEHKWLELNTYYVWASDTVGVSNQYGSTSVRASGVEFLNGEGDSIGTIGLNNDGTQLLIEGNGDPVHIASLTVDGSANVTSSLSVSGPIYTNGIIYANENIQCSGAISASDGVTVGSVTMTGNGNVLAINKSVNTSGSLTASQIYMSGNLLGINGAGGEPYYIGVGGGLVQIGMHNNGGTITGGGIKVSQLVAESMNITSFSAFRMTSGTLLSSDNYPMAKQTTNQAIDIPLGAIVLAWVQTDVSTYAGQQLAIGSKIQFMNIILDNVSNMGMSLNGLQITVTDNTKRYAPLSPITYWDSQISKYTNMTLVMRIL